LLDYEEPDLPQEHMRDEKALHDFIPLITKKAARRVRKASLGQPISCAAAIQ